MGSVAYRLGLADRAFDPASVRTIRTVNLKHSEDLHRVATMVADQIAAEQTLTATRMTWNLTFQGFTIAGFILVATAEASAPSRLFVQFLIAVVSATVTYATIAGIIASQQQRSYLRKFWQNNDLSSYFREPFSVSSGSALGRRSALWMCWALLGMWIVIIPAGYVLTERESPKHLVIDNLPSS